MKSIRQIMVLMLILVAGSICSCAKYIRVPNYFSATYLEFEGVADPCVKPHKIIWENLGGNGGAVLWKNEGVFYLHPAGVVREAYFTYRPGGGVDRRRYGRDAGRPEPVHGPEWRIKLPNAGSNGEVLLTITVVYEGREDEPWVGKFPIYNTNVRELCPHLKRR